MRPSIAVRRGVPFFLILPSMAMCGVMLRWRSAATKSATS
jgi:hypothetical protein